MFGLQPFEIYTQRGKRLPTPDLVYPSLYANATYQQVKQPYKKKKKPHPTQ
jgi:hypothetical protein